MENLTCRQCEHFHIHYILDKHRATPLDCGHCSYPRLKKRRPSEAACIHYSENLMSKDLPDRTGVLDFLTVEMLEYIMGLALPPEVEDA